jgi:hypothetical protein
MVIRMIRSLLILTLLMVSVNVANAQGRGDDAAVTTIVMEGTSITVNGNGATVNGSNVTITASGTYRLSGTLTDGQVAVDTEDNNLVSLILAGVDIRNSTSAAINIANANDAAIILEEGTQNYVTDATTYVYVNAGDDEPNAAIFSDDALTISGSGSLTVQANYNDGIASKDTLIITDATITVQSVDDGIRGKDYLMVTGAHLNVTTQGDGLKSDNEDAAALGYISIAGSTIDITAGGDAIQAQTNLTIDDGEFVLVSGGGSSVRASDDLSAKGLKAGVNLTINGGTFVVDSADDTLHANDSLTVNAGTFTLATGDDAIHADANITINGGSINITTSYEGIESAVITINGGEIHLVSSDDGVNAAGDNFGNYFLYIHGGYLVVNANGDGLDANGSIQMTGGTVIVNGPTMAMNSALDYDGSFAITGGFLVAAGSSRMAQVPGTQSTQNSLLINLDSAQQAGSLVHIQTSDGKNVLTFAPVKGYQSIAFSSPELATGVTYDVFFGGSADGTTADGLYQTGNYTGGTQATSFTVSSVVTQIGRSGRFR